MLFNWTLYLKYGYIYTLCTTKNDHFTGLNMAKKSGIGLRCHGSLPLHLPPPDFEYRAYFQKKSLKRFTKVFLARKIRAQKSKIKQAEGNGSKK